MRGERLCGISKLILLVFHLEICLYLFAADWEEVLEGIRAWPGRLWKLRAPFSRVLASVMRSIFFWLIFF